MIDLFVESEIKGNVKYAVEMFDLRKRGLLKVKCQRVCPQPPIKYQ